MFTLHLDSISLLVIAVSWAASVYFGIEIGVNMVRSKLRRANGLANDAEAVARGRRERWFRKM